MKIIISESQIKKIIKSLNEEDIEQSSSEDSDISSDTDMIRTSSDLHKQRKLIRQQIESDREKIEKDAEKERQKNSTSTSAQTASSGTSTNAYASGTAPTGAPQPIKGIQVSSIGCSQNWLNQAAYNEAGRPLSADLDDKHRYGVVVRGNNGKADNKGEHKTYGWGSLYDAFTGDYMDKTAGPNACNFRKMGAKATDEYLRKVFIKHHEKTTKHVKEFLGDDVFKTLYPNQVDAIASIIGNFGYGGFKRLKISKMIKNNPNDPALYNEWVHLSDGQGKELPGLIRRRHGEANWYFGLDPKPYLKHLTI